MSDLTIVCFYWRSENRKFTPEHVNILHRMVRRYESVRHRFVCITDEAGDYDEGVEIMATPKAALSLTKYITPERGRFHCAPSCYRRLWLFSEEAKVLGERVLQLDLDCVILGDVAKLGRKEGDFVGATQQHAWGNEDAIPGFCYMVKPGAFPGIAKLTQKTIDDAALAGWRGSDQAIVSYRLHDKVSRFPENQVVAVSSNQAREYPHKHTIVIAVTGLLGKPYNDGVEAGIPWWSLYYR